MLLLREQSHSSCGLLCLPAFQDLAQRFVWNEPGWWDMDMPRELAGYFRRPYTWLSKP